MTGRPTVMTEETVQKLEQAFLMGCTDREACLYADIAPSTLYAYAAEHKDFSERKETLKQNPFMLARKVVVEHLKEGDIQTAQKVLDRRDGGKLTLQGDADNPLTTKTVIEFVNADSTDT